MLNHNGAFIEPHSPKLDNRGLLLGDGVFETVRILDGKVLFLEDHYFRLMASMRILRMQIPMSFTMEFIESELLKTAMNEGCTAAARVRMTVYRSGGGAYLPETNEVEWIVSAAALEFPVYQIPEGGHEVELYKDFYIPRQLLSTLKTTNKLVNITGSIFAAENGYANCLLMNDAKNIVEALNGNLFVLRGRRLVTPPLTEGCLNGVMRRQIIALVSKIEEIEFFEEAVSPFDLQKADEIFITNVIIGIQPVTQYRKKSYSDDLSRKLLAKLNAQIRLA